MKFICPALLLLSLSVPTLAQKSASTEERHFPLGTVEFAGVDQLTVRKVLSTWKLKSGEVYDDNYPRQYMMSDFGRFVPQQFKWEWHNREVIHDDTKIVDLVIEVQFKPRSM